MKHLWRTLAVLLVIAVPATWAAAASADRGGKGRKAEERVFTLQPDPAGNPEGVAYDERSKAFFVSITADGAIYRGTLGSDTVSPFIEGGEGRAAIGVEVRRGLLYVAGGPTGSITVYDIATREAVATFQTGTGGFLNDLVVTRRGDVYVTDSLRPTLWQVTGEQVRAGSGTPQALDVSEIPYDAGFNVNGIERIGSRRLVVVDSNSGKLFRVDLGEDRSSIREIDEIEGATVLGGDGLLLDRGLLVAVSRDPDKLTFMKLRRGASRARVVDTLTSDKLRGPSTVDRAKGLYLVVNADFATSRRPFTVAGLPVR
jgi:hypothetical protein